MTISMNEEAYKIFNPGRNTKEVFDSYSFTQLTIPEGLFYARFKGYKIDREDKKVRVIKPILSNGIVTDISVLISVEDNRIVWDRG